MGVSMKRFYVALVLAVVLFSSVVGVQSVKASSKTIVVPDDFPTITAAVTNAAQGDTIFVKKGTYHENLRIDKSIQLIGEDRDTTILDGNLSASTGFPLTLAGYKVPLTITQDNVTIEDFTLRDSYAGIQLSGNYCKISGNRITNVQYGIVLSSVSGNSITGNVIDSVKTNGYGIEVSHASDNNVKRNQIISASIGIAIIDQLLSPSSVIFSENNNVSENNIADSKEYAIMLQFTSNNILIGNNISNSEIGTSIYVANNNNFYHNNFIDNTEQVSANEWYATQWGYSVSTNTWNENYWSDYNGTDNDKNGLGDTPYVINEKNADNRPLMAEASISGELPELIPEFPSWIILPLLIAATLFAIGIKKKHLLKGNIRNI